MESPHSPYGFHSPMRSELGDLPETQPFKSPENSQGKPAENSKAIVAVDRFTQYSPLPSPGDRQKKPENMKFPSPDDEEHAVLAASNHRRGRPENMNQI
jgi:hypothetical protein